MQGHLRLNGPCARRSDLAIAGFGQNPLHCTEPTDKGRRGGGMNWSKLVYGDMRHLETMRLVTLLMGKDTTHRLVDTQPTMSIESYGTERFQ